MQFIHVTIVFRFIAGNHHPDHDTIAHFIKRFLPEIRVWFKEILLIGKEVGFVEPRSETSIYLPYTILINALC